MAGKKREEVRQQDVTGLEYFDEIVPLLNRLRGNRPDPSITPFGHFSNAPERQSC